MTTPGAGLSPAAARARLVGLGVLLLVVAVTVTVVGPDAEGLRGFVDDLEVVGPIVYVLLYAVLTVLLVPGFVLTTAAGLLFGVVSGSIVSLAGAVIGSTISFVVARRLGRTSVERLASGRVAAVDEWLAERGLASVLTLRLVPLVPFSIANWAAGVTGIRLRDYLVGTAIGIVPGTVAYVAVGANATDPSNPAFVLAIGALVALTVIGIVVLRRRGDT